MTDDQNCLSAVATNKLGREKAQILRGIELYPQAPFIRYGFGRLYRSLEVGAVHRRNVRFLEHFAQALGAFLTHFRKVGIIPKVLFRVTHQNNGCRLA